MPARARTASIGSRVAAQKSQLGPNRSTFTAAMHRNEAMSGHVLPVLFSWHLGIALNEVAGAAQGALDPQEFWHAWAAGASAKVDTFASDWDFWSCAGEPLVALRERWSIPASGLDARPH